MAMMQSAILAIVALGATGVGGASAQDWLGTHLESQREENQRRHQQEMVTGPDRRKAPTARPRATLSGQVRAAAMRRHLRQYRQIAQARGYRAADLWLAEQVAAGR